MPEGKMNAPGGVSELGTTVTGLVAKSQRDQLPARSVAGADVIPGGLRNLFMGTSKDKDKRNPNDLDPPTFAGHKLPVYICTDWPPGGRKW